MFFLNFQILYYGMICQSTSEDWEDTKLTLSTAMPSIGGTIPKLGTKKLSFQPQVIQYGSVIKLFYHQVFLPLCPLGS